MTPDMIKWLKWFFNNCTTDYDPSEHEGHAEKMVWAYEHKCHPWWTASALQEGGDPWPPKENEWPDL